MYVYKKSHLTFSTLLWYVLQQTMKQTPFCHLWHYNYWGEHKPSTRTYVLTFIKLKNFRAFFLEKSDEIVHVQDYQGSKSSRLSWVAAISSFPLPGGKERSNNLYKGPWSINNNFESTLCKNNVNIYFLKLHIKSA